MALAILLGGALWSLVMRVSGKTKQAELDLHGYWKLIAEERGGELIERRKRFTKKVLLHARDGDRLVCLDLYADDTDRNNFVTHVRARARYDADWTLRLSKRDTLIETARAALPGSLRTGDEEFDREFLVTTSDERAARATLQDETLRAMLCKKMITQVRAENGVVRIVAPEKFIPLQTHETFIEIAATLARAMEAARLRLEAAGDQGALSLVDARATAAGGLSAT